MFDFLKKFFKYTPTWTWKQTIKMLGIRDIDEPMYKEFKELMLSEFGLEMTEFYEDGIMYGYKHDDIINILVNKKKELEDFKIKLKEMKKKKIENQIKNLQTLLETHYG